MIMFYWLIGGLLAYIFTVKYWYKEHRHLELEFDAPFTLKEKLQIHLFGLFLFLGGWVGLIVYFKCSKWRRKNALYQCQR